MKDFYENLRVTTEDLNRQDRGLPDRKSANLSSYQQRVIRHFCDTGLFEASISGGITMHGNRQAEAARVARAISILLASGVITITHLSALGYANA